MNKTDEVTEIIEILEKAGATNLIALLREQPCAACESAITACWVNGSKCGFGDPGGKLIDAPSWCSKCQQLLNNKQQLENIVGETDSIKNAIEDTHKKALSEAVDETVETAHKLLCDLIEEYSERMGSSEIIAQMLLEFVKVLNDQLKLDDVKLVSKDGLDQIFS